FVTARQKPKPANARRHTMLVQADDKTKDSHDKPLEGSLSAKGSTKSHQQNTKLADHIPPNEI
ncbi:MAG: hypothetical protein WCA08_22790, partial [Desulfoferrobacter sp.]